MIFLSCLLTCSLEYKRSNVATSVIVTTRCLCPLLVPKINKTHNSSILHLWASIAISRKAVSYTEWEVQMRTYITILLLSFTLGVCISCGEDERVPYAPSFPAGPSKDYILRPWYDRDRYECGWAGAHEACRDRDWDRAIQYKPCTIIDSVKYHTGVKCLTPDTGDYEP